MKVSMFSKEIIQIGDTFLALPLVSSVGPIFVNGVRGFGPVNYCFCVSSCMGSAPDIRIYSDEIEYYLLDNYDNSEEDPIYLDRKIELTVVRDELLELWAKYLEKE